MPAFYVLWPAPNPERWSYATDDGSLFVPGIVCDVCGATWGGPSGEVLRTAITDPALVRSLVQRRPLPREKHVALRRQLEAELAPKLGSVPDIGVGLRIGSLRVALSGLNLADISHLPFTPIINERVLQLLREHQITGFDTYPVTITKVARQRRRGPVEPPQVWELDVPGRAALAPEAQAWYQVEPPCPGCGRRGKLHLPRGLLVDETTWDGRDLFKLEHRAWVLMTQRVADLLTEAKLTGFTVKPAEELVIT